MINKEANNLIKLMKIAKKLDEKGRYKEADQIMKKLADNLDSIFSYLHQFTPDKLAKAIIDANSPCYPTGDITEDNLSKNIESLEDKGHNALMAYEKYKEKYD